MELHAPLFLIAHFAGLHGVVLGAGLGAEFFFEGHELRLQARIRGEDLPGIRGLIQRRFLAMMAPLSEWR
jgi:hypothetical protein